MGRDQTVRHHRDDSRHHRRDPLRVRQSAIASARQKSGERTPGEQELGQTRQPRLIRFFRRYPLALLLAAWMVFMLLAGAAIIDMTSLGADKPQVSEPIAPSESTQSAETPNQPLASAAPERSPQLQPGPNSLPLASLLAIASSCAMGCLIILQTLKPRRSPERSSSAFSKPTSPRPKAPSTKASSRLQQKAQTQSSSASSIAPSSIVPSNISQPLDWDEPSVADNLDLRQQRPLSYWL